MKIVHTIKDLQLSLIHISDLVREGGDAIFADVLDAQAEVTGKSFVDVFRNEYGYLLDYVDGNMTVSYTHLDVYKRQAYTVPDSPDTYKSLYRFPQVDTRRCV